MVSEAERMGTTSGMAEADSETVSEMVGVADSEEGRGVVEVETTEVVMASMELEERGERCVRKKKRRVGSGSDAEGGKRRLTRCPPRKLG